MPRLISQRKKVTPVGKLDDNRFNYLNLQNAQPALGPAPTDGEGYTLQTDGNGKATFSNTLGKLSFANSTITNTQAADIVIDNRGNGDIILSPLQKVLINNKAEVAGELIVDGDINVKGTNPRGTFPVVNNVLYVNENGDDANDGRAMDPSRAKRTIAGAVKSPYYQDGTTIRVASGHYWEDNPINLKPSTAIIGDDLRTTFVEPLNKEDDLFHVNSGVYIAFMAMLNLKKGSVERYAPGGAGTYTTGAYCVAFPPLLDNPIDVYYSPYIQNCTNQSGPWLFDGTMFRPNQTVQVPLGAGTASWNTNDETVTIAMNYGSVSVGMAINDYANVGYENAQKLLKANVNFFKAEAKAFIEQTYPDFVYDEKLCLRDVGLITTAVAGDARFGGNLRSREAGLSYWRGNYSLLPGEVTQTLATIAHLKALAAKVIINDTSGTVYQTDVTQFTDELLSGGDICATRLASSFDVITNLIANGPTALPAPQEMDYGLIHVSGLSPDDITSASTITNITSTSTGLANAQTLLKLNRSFIQSEVVAWINNTYPGFTYDQTLCYRDVGLILDAMSIDGVIGGNIQSRIAGLSYYTGATINIPGEVTQTVAAIGYIDTLAQQIITNTPVTAISTATQVIRPLLTNGADASEGITRSANVITSIIISGPTTAPAEEYPTLDQYVVTLSSPAVSFGNLSTIYVGRTTVYPVQDKNIPQEWIAARAINPSGSGGGALIDGNAPSLKSPIQSFVFDAFTQLNQGGIGIHITNNGYAQLVSVFTIFCDIGVLTENGGIASITNSNANFGNFALMSKGLGHLEFSGIVWNPAYPTNIPNGEYYPQGYWPQNGNVEIYIPDLVNRPHIGLTMEVVPPKTYIDYAGNRVPYVNARGFPGFLTAAPNTSTITKGAYTIEGIDTSDISIGQNFYITDISSSQHNEDGIMYINSGTIVTDVGFQSVTFDQPINVDAGDPTNDLYFNLYFCGNAYYNVLSSQVDPTVSQPTTPTFIEGEIEETSSAIRHARDVVSKVITNTPITDTYQSTYTQYINPDFKDGANAVSLLEDKFNIIADIIQYGQLAAPKTVMNSQIKNTNQGVLNAAKLVDENKTFIQAEVTAFVDKEFVGFTYDQDKCFRDTGLIVDSIAFDLLYGGTSQSTFSGLQYYNQGGYTGKIPEEIYTTTNAISYVSDLAQRIVTNNTGGVRYQNNYTQVTNLPAGDATAVAKVKSDFKVITDILANGTVGVTDIVEPNGVASTTATILNAYNLLQANKQYIQAEAIAFVEATKNLSYKFDRVKCVRDTGIILDSMITDLVFPGNGYTQSNFSGLQYWNQGSYTGAIAGELTTTTNAVNYISSLAQQIVTNSTGTRYQSTVTQVLGTTATVAQVTAIANDFSIITTILTTGTAGVTDLLVSPGTTPVSTDAQHAYDLLLANKAYIQAEAVAYVEATKHPLFTYDKAKCGRDAGYMVDSVAFDILYGGNRQAIQSGVCYYSFSTSTAIPSEIPETVAAYNRLKTILPLIVTNQTVTPSDNNVTPQVTNSSPAGVAQGTALQNMATLITNIISTGSSAANALLPVSLTKDTSANVANAVALINANRDFITSEIIAYIDSTFSVGGYAYDEKLCARDTGLIVDALVQDLMFGGTSQSTFAGIQYWAQSGYTGQIAGELTTTTNAITYAKTVAEQVLTNTTATRFQSTVTQVTNLPTATSSEVTTVGAEFDLIVDILTNGIDGVTDRITPNGIVASTSTNVNNAHAILVANKGFIQAEVLAYVESTKTLGYTFDSGLCYRDVGYMVDAITIDLLYGGNRQAIQSGVYYYGYTGTTQVPNEIPQVLAAYNHIKQMLPYIVKGQSTSTYQSYVPQVKDNNVGTNSEVAIVQQALTTITNIITNGPTGITKTPLGTVASTNPNVVNAASILTANRDFIKAETIAYINHTFNVKYYYDQTKCARDTGIILDSILLDVLHPTAGNSQSTFAGLQYYNQGGYTGQIAGELTTTTNAINYIKALAKDVVQNITTGTRYQNTVTQVTGLAGTESEVNVIEDEFTIITDILTNGTAGVTDLLVANSIYPSTNADVQQSYALLKANKAYIQAEAVAYVEATKSVGYTYSQSLCSRDAGYMVDSVAFDLLYGGNRQAIQSGVYYYAFNNSSSAIPGESTQTVAAFNFLGTLVSKLVTGASITPIQTIVSPVTTLSTATSAEAALLNSKVGIITNIITSGTSVVSSKSPITLTRTTNTNVLKAAEIVNANRAFITAETLAYINSTFEYSYDESLCARDVGYMVDSVSFDLLHGGNRQAVHSGVYYYGFSDVSAIEGNRIETQFAYNHIADIATALLTGVPITTTYSDVAQVTNIVPATPAEADRVIEIINTITEIIVKGPEVATNKTPIALTPSSDANVQNAFDTLLANREFIQAETVAFVNAMFTKFSYDKVKCARDTGIIVDSLAIDLLYNGSTQSNFAGLQYWNQDAYTGQIAGELTTTTAAINYIKDLAQKVVLGITTGTRYQNSVTQNASLPVATTVSAAIIAGEFDIITNILNNGTAGVTDIIVANGNVNGSPEYTNAYALLEANKNYLQHEAVAFVEATKTGGYHFDRDTCARDVGYILDGVYYDIALGSNYNAVTSGRAYYRNVVSSQNVIDLELPQTLSAVNYAKAKTALLVGTSTTATTRSNASFDETIDIMTNGSSAANVITFPSPTGGNVNHDHAVTLLQANKAFMKAEITAWINVQKSGNISPFTSSFTYDVTACERDVGDIVDALCYDVMYGTNWASVIAARAYFTYAVSVLPSNERAPSVAAMNHLSSIAQQIVQKQTVVKSSGNTQTQNTTGSAATSDEATTIGSLVSIITNVITANDVTTLPNIVYPSITWAEQGVQDAVTNLAYNRAYIIDNTVQNTRLKFSSFFTYNEDSCLRDTGLIIDSIATDLLYGGSSQSAFAGLQYWNQDGYTGLISSELTTASNAISYMAGLISGIVNAAGGTTPQATVDANFGTLVDILNNGTADVTNRIVPNGTATTDANTVAAYNAIQTVKNSVINQTINWINDNNDYTYDRAKCARDTRLILSDVVMDLLFDSTSQTTFSGLQYWNHGSYVGNIAGELTTTTNAVNYLKSLAQKIVVNDTSGTRYTRGTQVTNLPAATSSEQTAIANDFTVITDILTNGVAGVTDRIVSNGNEASTNAYVENAYALLQANKAYLQAEVVAYVEKTKSANFVYDKTKCSRDAGYMIDAVSIDLRYGGNRQAVQSGVYYYSWNASSTALPYEQTQAVGAYNYIKSILPNIIEGTAISSPYQNTVSQVRNGIFGFSAQSTLAQSKIDVITGIITNGPSVAATGVPLPVTPTGNADIENAAVMITRNIDFIVAETIAYVDATYTTFSYDETKCRRDLGYILDSVSFDLLNGGNRQSIMSAVYYYGFDATSTVVANEKPQVTAAYNYIKDIVGKIVTGVEVSPTRQPYIKQVITSNTATSAEAAELLDNLNLITDIINLGPDAAPAHVPVGLTASTDSNVNNAYELLMANREFIKEEVIAFTNSEFIGPAYSRDKCRRDTGLIVDALAQDLLFDGSSQSNFAGLQYWGQNGYTGEIGKEVTTTTNTLNYIRDLAKEVVQNITTGLRMEDMVKQVTTLPPATRVEAEIIAERIDLIANIISNGTDGVTDMIVPNGLTPSDDVNIQRAYAILEANKNYLQAQAVAFVEDTKTSQFTYDQTTCYRDVGYIVDSVAFDLLYGGNKQSIHSGISYYAYNSNVSAVANEIQQTTAAYDRIKQIVPSILQNILIEDAYQSLVPQVFMSDSATTAEATAIQANIDLMTNIITNGPSAGQQRQPISLNRSTNANVITAAELLEANKEFIKEEVIAYVNYNFGGFQYDQAKCFRDVGYMIDSVAFDLLHGGNRQAVQSGVYYYNFDGNTTAVPNEIPQVTAAYNYIKTLMSKVVTATTATGVFQTGTVQVTNLPKATTAQATLINNNITLITDIINNGPSVANAKTPVGLTASGDTNVIKAYNLLRANRQFIVDEVTAYIDKTFVTFSYNQNKCFRDVNTILDAVVYDVLWGGNYRSVNSGNGYYARKGRYHIAELEQGVTDPTVFIDGSTVNFYQTSYQSASGYLFEYIGAGSNYSALPQIGRADPIQSHETVQLSNGKVFFTSTDQNGDFRIGPGLVISQATGVLYGRTFQKSLYAEMTPFILVVGA